MKVYKVVFVYRNFEGNVFENIVIGRNKLHAFLKFYGNPRNFLKVKIISIKLT